MKTIKISETDKNNKITKMNRLVEARYRLTPTEQKVLFFLISKIQPHDIEFTTYRIEIKEFEKLLEVKRSNLYKEMFVITENIMKEVLKVWDEKEEKFIFTHWVQRAVYEKKTGYAEFKFDEELKPFLLNIKNNFVSYHLKHIVQLKSSYSIRLYELLKQYQSIGKRTFEIKELREILGIKPTEYKRYNDFKRKVILISQTELPKKTDLSFEFKEIKLSRRVVEIEFIISQIVQALPEKKDPKPKIRNLELYNRLIDYFCLSANQAKESLDSYDDTYIEENLEVVSERYQAGKIEKTKLGSYTLKALKEDFRPKISQFDKETAQKEAEKREREQEARRKQETLDHLLNDFRDKKESLISEVWEGISLEKQAIVIDEFKEKKIEGILIETFEEKGFEHMGIKAMFDEYLEERFLGEAERDFIEFARSEGYKVVKKNDEYYLIGSNDRFEN